MARQRHYLPVRGVALKDRQDLNDMGSPSQMVFLRIEFYKDRKVQTTAPTDFADFKMRYDLRQSGWALAFAYCAVDGSGFC